MTKKTVSISEKLIVSILIGFGVAVVIVISAHLFPSDWNALPQHDSSGYFTYGAKVDACSYKCLLGERHSANCSGLKFYEVNNKSLTIDEIFSASFEHTSTLIIIGLVLSAIIYIFKRVNFRVVKD